MTNTKKKLIFISGIILILSWTFIYNYDYINIPTTAFTSNCYYLFVSFIYIIPIILILLEVIIKKDKPLNKNKLLLSIFFIVTLNLIILIYNRNETIEFTENYITQKETKNGNYYIFVNNESRLKCPKKIYISILPKRNYVLTYRSNKLRPFNKKIVSATEIE